MNTNEVFLFLWTETISAPIVRRNGSVHSLESRIQGKRREQEWITMTTERDKLGSAAYLKLLSELQVDIVHLRNGDIVVLSLLLIE